MASVMGLLHKEPMPFRVLRNTFLIGTVVALLTTSCVKSASVRLDVPEDHSAFERDDAVTIVSTRSASCIHDSLRQVQPTLRVVSPGDFRSAALPPRASDEVTFAYPMSESQQKLLSSQDFRDRIAPLRLRYLVMVGEKEMVTRRDEAAGQGGLMSRWWTRLTLTASVIDLKDGHEARANRRSGRRRKDVHPAFHDPSLVRRDHRTSRLQGSWRGSWRVSLWQRARNRHHRPDRRPRLFRATHHRQVAIWTALVGFFPPARTNLREGGCPSPGRSGLP